MLFQFEGPGVVHAGSSGVLTVTSTLISFILGYKDGASSVALQGTVREEEESVVSRASEGVQGGLEDCIQR